MREAGFNSRLRFLSFTLDFFALDLLALDFARIPRPLPQRKIQHRSHLGPAVGLTWWTIRPLCSPSTRLLASRRKNVLMRNEFL
jgi:hypothetical protein